MYARTVPARIVLYTASRTYGGAERVMLQQAAGFKRLGFEPHVMIEWADGHAELLEQCRIAGVPATSLSRGNRLTFQVRLTRALGHLSPLVFHLHRGWPAPGAAAILSAAMARVPVIVVHEHLWAAPPSRSRVLNRIVGRWVSQYVAVSEDVARHLVEDLGLRRERIRVIHNGIAAAEVRSGDASQEGVSASASRRDRVALTVARLVPQKGLETLVDAAALLPNVRFLIAGEGPERAQLESLAQDRRVSERVCFLGYSADVRALLGAVDIFVLPSLFEGLPISVLEAMAAGRPVVATDVEGTREAVVAGESGILVPPGDPVALANAISTVLHDDELRARLVKAALERVRSEFSEDAMIASTAALYQELLSSPLAR